MFKKICKIMLVVSLFTSMHTDAGCKKCRSFCTLIVQCLRVLGNEIISGDLTVDGQLTVGGVPINNLIGLAGAIGPAGATGAVGPQGPAGAPGIPGIGGVLGYAYACNTAAEVVPAGGDVTFNLSASPSAGITPPAPGGTSFTILTSGVYLIQYHVRGTPESLTPPSALQFEVTANGTPLACATYASSVQSTSLAADGTEAVNGYSIVTLTAGDVISLHNITLSSADSVSLAAVPVGGTSAVNASMYIIRIA